MRVRRTVTGVIMTAVLVGAVSCSSTGSGTNAGGSTPGGSGTTIAAAPVDYSKPGPYRVGTMTLTVGATKAVVYYPADGAAAASARHVTSYSSGEAFNEALRAYVAQLVPEFVQNIPIDAYADVKVNPEGPFPAVIHSHGFGGFYLFASQHFIQEASWGFVVAAPDHLSRDLSAVAAGPSTDPYAGGQNPDVQDLDATLAALTKENARQGGPLYGGVNTDTVGAEGHSAGGRASYLFAAAQPNVKAWIGQAPSAPVAFDADQSLTPDEQLAAETEKLKNAPPLGKPSMIVEGEKDSVVPIAGVQLEYNWLAPPKRMLVVANAGHASFIDVCKPIRDLGGLDKYAGQLPSFAPLFKLGDDGCAADNIDPVKAYAFINHVMIAQYRYVFGDDPTDVSLSDAYLKKQFPEAFGGQQSQQ